MSGTGDLLPEDPRSIGQYTLIGRLGSGGQGTVYVGRSADGHQAAVKLLNPHLLTDEGARRRFLSEFETAKRVAPFCAARVLDAGFDGRWPFIVAEYVEGPSLQESVQQSGPRGGPALERLAINTAAALSAIHQAEVVHLDFKPGNVLLGPDGPVVIDFGISRALDLSVPHETSRPMGTPGYMAPEMITGGEVGPAADLFAWGATMVYAATGQRAFNGDSGAAVVRATLHSDPDLSCFDARLRGLVQACLAKDPARRPTAAEVAERLRGTAPPLPATTSRRRWVPAAAVTAALLITGGVGYVVLWPAITQAERGTAPLAASSAAVPTMSPLPTPSPIATASRTPKTKLTGKAMTTAEPVGSSTPKASQARATPQPSVKPSRDQAQPTPTQQSSKPTTKAPDPDKTEKASPTTVTLGTVDTNDLAEYCKAQGYFMVESAANGGYNCTLPAWDAGADKPGTLPVTWADACRWKYPDARSVVADGQTCKGNG